MHNLVKLVVFFVFLGMVSQGNAQSPWYASSWPDTDFDLRSVELREILSGGPPKDGIPAIDRPVFVDISDAVTWIDPLEPVIAVEIGGEARAYPLQILTYHEIVNDEINGVPVSITFCPLCNASIVFDRRVKDEILDFGTTGMLRKSDLIMYDRQTESWWQQFSGEAIVGAYLDTELARIPSSIVSFESFQRAFPNGRVLGRDTGFSRPYGNNPYAGYDDINQNPFLYDGPLDDRLPPMERVLSVTIGEINRIYPLTALEQQKLVNDRVGSVPVTVFALGELRSALDRSSIADSRTVAEATAWNRIVDDGTGELSFEIVDGAVYDQQTGSRWNVFGRAVKGPLKDTQLEPLDSGVHFAFAWLAFNPDSEIYRPDG